MLEEKIDALIASMDRLTVAVGGGASTPGTGKPGRPPKTTIPDEKLATVSSKYTFEAVKAAVIRVKDGKGKPAAQAIIKNVGKASELIGIKAPQFKAVIDACEAALSEDEAEEEEAEDEEDRL